jgi:hypothetical protein
MYTNLYSRTHVWPIDGIAQWLTNQRLLGKTWAPSFDETAWICAFCSSGWCAGNHCELHRKRTVRWSGVQERDHDLEWTVVTYTPRISGEVLRLTLLLKRANAIISPTWIDPMLVSQLRAQIIIHRRDTNFIRHSGFTLCALITWQLQWYNRPFYSDPFHYYQN